jgi:hypothetical protein
LLQHLEERGIWHERKGGGIKPVDFGVFARQSVSPFIASGGGRLASRIASFFFPRLLNTGLGVVLYFFTYRKPYEGSLGVAIMHGQLGKLQCQDGCDGHRLAH